MKRTKTIVENRHDLGRSVCLVISLWTWVCSAHAASPQEGYRLLTEKAYLPADFDQATFDELWTVWPEPLRTLAERATLNERRRLAYQRYGIHARPQVSPVQPLQYVVTADGQWHMNCFACHGGSVNGQTWPGAPNTQYALELLTVDVRQTKLRLGKPLSHMDVGSLFMPLGTSRGTTNAVMFGVALLAYRDADLNLLRTRLPPAMTHHDMDAPPWWHFRKKRQLYIDGFAPKAVRPLMQFMLVEQNGPSEFRDWETDFEHVYAYLSSLEPPRYPFPIDQAQATAGEQVFVQHCAECHGTYGNDADYPERVVPWEEIRTDPVRLRALSPQHRARYAASWFAVGHPKRVEANPVGYVAPPLDGVWASAPYFHNGSVPTIWHLLHPQQRPTVWTRRDDRLDQTRLGWQVDEWPTRSGAPSGALDRGEVFDTTQFGKSAAGHEFVDRLSELEKNAVIEYLKSL